AVSRHHLRLDVRADGILVSDLGSHNGSFFQGARFREVTVGVGAIILIGATELKIATVESAGRILPSSSDRFGALLGRSLAMRVLQQRAVKPVGASSYRDVDVRVIAATNRDLRAECAAGRFRDDLFHRLAVVRARLPPLRERKEDLAPLVEHLLAGRGLSVPVETLALLTEYDWPGNVRELENVLEHGTSLVGDGRALTPELLGLEPPSSRSPRRDAPDA